MEQVDSAVFLVLPRVLPEVGKIWDEVIHLRLRQTLVLVTS